MITPFSTQFEDILKKVSSIDPVDYGKTRNFINGSVTYLSPYISRGVISTQYVYQEILKQGHKPWKAQKLIQELAWRDYWQQVWIAKGTLINFDLKHEQPEVSNHKIPSAILNAKTGIIAIDKALEEFYQTGYLHNHLRMYIAALACNFGKSHWKLPARWMYYHLLDADWASNALSWQWVAGANSNKKYIANQENINKYCNTQQQHTFLDIPYENIPDLQIPRVLEDLADKIKLETPLPKKEIIFVDSSLPTAVYNFYNLDPLWKKDINTNNVLLLEPSHFREYPVSQKTLDFVLGLSKNIEGVQIYVGEFDELIQEYHLSSVHYKEHPTNSHYKGIEEPRAWMFDVKGYFPSFFSFWKKCQKQITY